ncbi:MAG: hypothetical protein ACF8QF_14265 [Phycisphaerales bacterium]
MGISRQALDQVRGILRELDQRIDDARQQRTNDGRPEDGAPTHDEHSDEAPARSHATPDTPATPGRARPKRPSF